jgi:hypothetical protein
MRRSASPPTGCQPPGNRSRRGSLPPSLWAGGRWHSDGSEGGHLVASVEELLEEARRLGLSSTEGRFRLGEIIEALRRQLPAAADLHDRLAIDLEVDRGTLTEAWFVASAFPPATRRFGLPWTTYLILRFHPERHELVDRAASAGWDQTRIQQELSVRFTAHHRSRPPDQIA